MYRIALITLLAAFLALPLALPAMAAKVTEKTTAKATEKVVTVPIVKHFYDSIPTNAKGTSLGAPPRIQTIRSERGAAHMITRLKQNNNRAAHRRIKKIQKQIDSIDFSKQMLVAIFSPPMDNYSMKIKKIIKDDGIIKVGLTYSHKVKEYRIPPKKSIHYEMIVLKNLPQPVLLDAREKKIKSKVKETRKVTVTGRLMFWKASAYQLIPVKIRRGKKTSYYIRGEILADLEPYLGRVVTLSGTVSHERDGPYERELENIKLVKAYD